MIAYILSFIIFIGTLFINPSYWSHSETLKVDKKDASEQVIYEAKVKVETIGIEKAKKITERFY